MPIRIRPTVAVLACLACANCASQTATVAPTVVSSTGGDAPHIDGVTFKPQPPGSDLVQPELHFHAAGGNVQFVDQAVVETTGPPFKVNSGRVDITTAEQKLGAVYTFPLRCGPGAYRATIRAYLINSAGDRSNTVEYTVRCNGA